MEMQISEVIKKARKAKRYSQAVMAEMLKVPRSTYAEWEGGIEPKATVMKKISEILEIDIGRENEGTNVNKSDNSSYKLGGGDGDLAKTLIDLISVTKEQAEITRIQAETADKHAAARMREAENNSRLIAMLETRHGTTDNAERQKEIAFSAKIEGLLESLADVAAGKKFHSPEEAAAFFRRRIYARQGGGELSDIQID